MSKSSKKKDGLANFNLERLPINGVAVRISKDTPMIADTLDEMLGLQLHDISTDLTVAYDEHNIVEVSGDIEVGLSGFCARCGKGITWLHQSTMSMRYAPDPGGKGAKNRKQLDRIHREIELYDSDLDIGYYQEGRISILDVVGEYVFMVLPSTLRCETEGVDADEADCQIPQINW